METIRRDPDLFTGSKAKVPVNPPSQFQIFKFKKDGVLLLDQHGRKAFSMLPSTAEALAASMGAQALRV